MANPALPAAMIETPTSIMFTIDEHISTDQIYFLNSGKKKLKKKIDGKLG